MAGRRGENRRHSGAQLRLVGADERAVPAGADQGTSTSRGSQRRGRPADDADPVAADLIDATFRMAEADLRGSSPLQAELWAAEAVDMWASMDDVDPDGDALSLVAGVHIDRALVVATPAARLVVGALARIVPDPDLARRAADAAVELDRRKVRLPSWADGLGDRRFRRALLMDHVLDDGHSVFLGFAYPGGSSTRWASTST